MRFALMTEPQLGGGYDDLSWAARAAERAGLEAFARSDHYYWRGGGDPQPATEAFSSLGGIARETSRVRLAVLVSPITFRHPSFIVKAAATLDEMSGGRFDLGLGTGWMEAEHQAYGIDFPPRKERFARLEDALGYVRAAFTGEPYKGDFYSTSAVSYPCPSGLRIIVGGTGTERTPSLAGRFADEFNVSSGPYTNLETRFDLVRESAQAAGRNPHEITISVMGPAIVAENQASLDRLLTDAAVFRNVSVPALVERWREAQVPFGVVGEVADAFGRLAEAGVQKYYLQWWRLADHDGIDRLVNVARDL